MTLWKYTLRELQRRPVRTLLTLLGIVIGVGAVVAITTTAQATRSAYRSIFESISGRAALEIVADGLGGFEEGPAVEAAKVPGVRATVPIIQAPAGVAGHSGTVPVLLLGIDPDRDAAARTLALREGQPLQDQDGVLLEGNFARSQGLARGDSVRLLTVNGLNSLPIVGILDLKGAAIFNGGAAAFVPLRTAQRLLHLPDRINSLQLVLEDGASEQAVQAEVSRRLPAGLSVQTPASRGALAQEALFGTEQMLACLCVASLVAGGFVILNTCLMNLGERQRQLAILRALGTTRGQLTRLLLAEGLVLGVAGTVLGIAGGLGLAVFMVGVMEALTGMAMPGLHLTAATCVIAAILGPGVVLAATWVPVRRAGRRAPLDVLLARGSAPAPVRRWPVAAGVVLVLLMVLLVIGLIRDWYPPSWHAALLAPGLASGLTGFVLALPLIVLPLAHLVGRVLRPMQGAAGRLAQRQLFRQPGRTALTAGVLFVGVTVGLGYGNTLLCSIRKSHEWYEKTIVADFLVRGYMPDTTLLFPTAIPEQLGEEMAALDGIERVDKITFVLGRARAADGTSHRMAILVRSFAPDRPPRLDLAGGEPMEVLQRLQQGETAVGGALAQRLGLRVGDLLTLETPQGPRSLRIAAKVNEYTVGGMVTYVEWETGKRMLDVKGVNAFEVAALPGRAAAVEATLGELCRRERLTLQPNRELLAIIDKAIGQLSSFLYLLIVLVFVVASLGIINTLTMNVHEQTRELGVLRALGMQRGQVGRMVLWQALTLAIISVLPGIAVGILVSYLMNLSTETVLGLKLVFRVDPFFVVLCSGLGVGVSLLAAFLPARQAARLPVIEALQYE